MAEAAGAAFVLIHGGHQGSWFWERVTPLLDGSALAVDLPGRGRHPADLSDRRHRADRGVRHRRHRGGRVRACDPRRQLDRERDDPGRGGATAWPRGPPRVPRNPDRRRGSDADGELPARGSVPRRTAPADQRRIDEHDGRRPSFHELQRHGRRAGELRARRAPSPIRCGSSTSRFRGPAPRTCRAPTSGC